MELERIKKANIKINSELQELKLEISYYKAEAQRLELEKNILIEEKTKNYLLYEQCLATQKSKRSQLPLENTYFLRNILENPIKEIINTLSLSDIPTILTTAQYPYHLEYFNKKWSSIFGWSSSEVLGLSLEFLNGEATNIYDLKMYYKTIRESGYGTIDIIYYSKEGAAFYTTLKTTPVYDSIRHKENNPSIPVITHHLTTMEILRVIPKLNLLAHFDILKTFEESSSDMNFHSYTSLGISNKKHFQNGDRRLQSLSFKPRIHLSIQSFLKYSNELRLSNLLRLMMLSYNAMVLLDNTGLILHVNKAWSDLTGYDISYAEGETLEILNRDDIELAKIKLLTDAIKKLKPMCQTLSIKNKQGNLNSTIITIVPIVGNKNTIVSHFCVLIVDTKPTYLESIDSINDKKRKLNFISNTD